MFLQGSGARGQGSGARGQGSGVRGKRKIPLASYLFAGNRNYENNKIFCKPGMGVCLCYAGCASMGRVRFRGKIFV